MSISAGDSQARSRFQNGLLTWLRAAAPQDHANGLREMIAVTRTLADGEGSSGSDGLLWRSAGSFLQALLDGSLNADDEARALCRRLERQLASPGNATRDNADALASAIFAFVSNRLPSPAGAIEPAALPASSDAGLNALMASTFAATAEVLPLLGKTQTRRLSDPQLQRWKQAIADLRRDWHAVQAGRGSECRAAAIALLQLALELADPPSLRLADAFAEAGGAAEDPNIRALPGFRAAFTAALEVAEHADGPDQKGFADSAAALAARLASAAIVPKGGGGLVCAGAPWFAEDARETLAELAAALDAVPPKRLALLAGLDWFIQHDAGKVMAIRGLATTAQRIVGQIRSDDLDETETHAVLGRTIAALVAAVNELADGLPPRPDEDVFADLRALDAKISEQRRQAIAAAKMTNVASPPPTSGAPPLQ